MYYVIGKHVAVQILFRFQWDNAVLLERPKSTFILLMLLQACTIPSRSVLLDLVCEVTCSVIFVLLFCYFF